jgi:hypothetical protein
MRQAVVGSRDLDVEQSAPHRSALSPVCGGLREHRGRARPPLLRRARPRCCASATPAVLVGLKPIEQTLRPEQRVRFRMERQQTAADITVIIGEGALALNAGSTEVMAAQAEHLLSVSAEVRVLPFAAGPSPHRQRMEKSISIKEWPT